MLFNQRFMFLHVPKTAGKSLTRYFVDAWDRPLTAFVSPGQVRELEGLDLSGVTVEVARGHETLPQSARICQERGVDPLGLEAIFVCLRNPYELMVSTYFFMRATFADNRDNPRFQLAHEADFERFVVEVAAGSPLHWLRLDGKKPANLRVLRFADLAGELAAARATYGWRDVPLPHLNLTAHDHFSTYVTPVAEEAIYQKMKPLFDGGYFARYEGLGTAGDTAES